MTIIVALCTLAFTSCQHVVRTQQMSELSDSVETITINYELPQILDNRNQQIIEHLAYTVSYNHDWLIPNWVAYELTDHEVSGNQERSNHFAPDPLVHSSGP